MYSRRKKQNGAQVDSPKPFVGYLTSVQVSTLEMFDASSKSLAILPPFCSRLFMMEWS